MSIEICIYLYAWQERCRWCLSSLLDQRGWRNSPVPSFSVRLDASVHDPFSEKTRLLESFFAAGLKLRLIEHEGRSFESRGAIRDAALRECAADWILFLDSDTVFHPRFLAFLAGQCLKQADARQLLTVPRYNADTLGSYSLIEQNASWPLPVDQSFRKAWDLQVGLSMEGSAPGAGYFQLVSMDYARGAGLRYPASPGDCNPADAGYYWTPSDIEVREQFSGGVRNLARRGDADEAEDWLRPPPIVHLNHFRARTTEAPFPH